MRQKQQNLTNNEHLKHFLKAKELALQGALKCLEKQYQNKNCLIKFLQLHQKSWLMSALYLVKLQ